MVYFYIVDLLIIILLVRDFEILYKEFYFFSY